MLKKDLAIQILKQTDNYLKNKKVIGPIEDESGAQIMKEIVGLRTETYSYSKDNNDEDKKAKGTKIVIKRKLNFQDYKNCLERAQIENRIKHLEKNKIDVDSLKEEHKEFVKKNKLILKTQHRFRSESIKFLLKKSIRLL